MKPGTLYILLLCLFFTVSLHSFSLGKSTNIPNSKSSDLEIIRDRVRNDLLNAEYDVMHVREAVQNLAEDGSWADINYEDLSRTGFEHSRHLQRMLGIALAFQKIGGPLYKDTTLQHAIHASLDYWLKHDFICENWWWNEMGTPKAIIDLLLMMDDDLLDQQKLLSLQIAGRANMKGVGARPGGDLIQIAAMMGKRALFERDEQLLEDVLAIMADEIKITTGRGLKPDMSFHHRVDNVISTLSYGSGYIASFAYWMIKIKGTQYTLPNSATELLIDYFLDGMVPAMVHGVHPDPGARNREMTRKEALDPIGPELAEQLAQASTYRNDEIETIIAIQKGEVEAQLRKTRFFWHSEYFSHQRPNYFTSVRMHSSRNHTMEEPHNEEGLKMHHFGDGSNFISVSGREYVDVYPVWDWQKIPGITAVQKPELPHWKEIAKKGLTDFVGGVTDSVYGAAAFDFSSAHDPLLARKAWFFFEKEFLCLGTGILSAADYPVYTTLNQTSLRSQVMVKQGTSIKGLARGTHHLSDVSWVWHDQVAYFFLQPTIVNIENKTATGSWRQISHQAGATDQEVEKDLFTLWLDHGTRPQHANYTYMVIPNADVHTLNRYEKQSPVEILANTPQLQAVKHHRLDLYQLVLYQAQKINLNKKIWVKSDKPCLLMVQMEKGNLQKIVVSDPSHKEKQLELQTNAKIINTDDRWEVAWDPTHKVSRLTIKLPEEGYAGQSVVIDLE